jgi:hypothetical protein
VAWIGVSQGEALFHALFFLFPAVFLAWRPLSAQFCFNHYVGGGIGHFVVTAAKGLIDRQIQIGSCDVFIGLRRVKTRDQDPRPSAT